MGVPTQEELQTALAEAAHMRESGDDPHFMAKVLLNHNHRIDTLEKVLQAAELFLRTGRGSHEEAVLIKAIAAAKYASANTADKKPLDYGL